MQGESAMIYSVTNLFNNQLATSTLCVGKVERVEVATIVECTHWQKESPFSNRHLFTAKMYTPRKRAHAFVKRGDAAQLQQGCCTLLRCL